MKTTKNSLEIRVYTVAKEVKQKMIWLPGETMCGVFVGTCVGCGV